LAHTPVIASFAPGLDETLPDNWPLRFHLNNDDELYSIFDKIYKREFDMERIREIAFDFVINKFSLDKMIQRYSNLYSRML
jgi:glycosyltransferase involved in cell wall biosynthesis